MPTNTDNDRAPDSWSRKAENVLSIGIAGIGVGVLVGLSASPVVSTVVSALLTLAAGGTVVLAGLSREEGAPSLGKLSRQISPSYIALLVAAVVVGAAVGLYARTHNVFGPSLAGVLSEWTGPGKLSSGDVTSRLFDIAFPPASTTSKSEGNSAGSKDGASAPSPAGSHFYGFTTSECTDLTNAPLDQLRGLMAGSARDWVRELAANVQDAKALNRIVVGACKNVQ